MTFFGTFFKTFNYLLIFIRILLPTFARWTRRKRRRKVTPRWFGEPLISTKKRLLQFFRKKIPKRRKYPATHDRGFFVTHIIQLMVTHDHTQTAPHRQIVCSKKSQMVFRDQNAEITKEVYKRAAGRCSIDTFPRFWLAKPPKNAHNLF